MKAPVSFDNFPTFAANGSRDMNPESAKYSVGFVPADTFPAEWANYMFHGATKGVSDLNTAVASIWAENANVLTQAGITPEAENNGQLYSAIMKFINDAVLTANQQVLAQALAQAKLDAHPVGSLYWSSDPTNPSTLFGGTWTQIKDRFIWAKGDSDTVNATGGSKTVQLTESNLPAHNHGGSTGYTNTDHWHTTWGMSEHSYGEWGGTDGGILGSTSQDRGFVHNEYKRNFDGNGSYPSLFWCTANIEHYHNTKSVGETYSNNNQNHSHTISSVGNNIPHENMPPYIVKYCWERTA
jgi:hypothetical protein